MKLLILFCLLLSLPAMAQETTASGNLSQQASWNTLKNMIERTDGNVSILRTDLGVIKNDVDSVKNCGSQERIWKPNVGCVLAATDSSALNTYINNANSCGSRGMVFNGSGCVNAAVPTQAAPNCRIETSMPLSQSGNVRGCPSGFTEGFGRTTGITTTYCVRTVCN